jgi:tetratricopeptide (TPR) repeat protein
VLLGRPDIYDDLVEAFEQPVPTIHVNADKNAGDITTYVKRSIRKSRQMSRIPKTQRLTIEEALITKAEGMFLWVDLMLTELNGKTRAGSMLESLHKAPKGLDAMLRHVLETFSGRLNDEEAIDLNIILAWVACADRPLSLRELDEILNVQLETHDDRLALEDALRTQYASLFVLNREDGFTTADLVGGANRGVNQPRNDESAGNSDSTSEADPEPEFNSEPHTTRVVFCHASIRDFLRNPDYGKVSAGDGSTPVGVDIVQASLSTLKMCLLVIAKGPLGLSVRDYALRYWVSKLRHLCQYLDKINRQQRQEIILLLCTIFRGANLELLYTYTAPEPVIEFINGETMTLIMSLFADEECVNTIDDTETRQWIRLCLEEPAQVFVPLGLEVAERWLIDSWDPAVFCMEIVLAVIVLLGEDPPELTERPSAETVLEVARWAQYEENAIWHHQVGVCLSSLEHYDAAIEHLTAALALEPLWRTKLDLAEVYWKRDCLNDSLRLFRECEANYAPPPTTPRTKHKFDPEKEKSRDLAKLRVRMGVLYIQLGDHSSATKSLMESIRLWESGYVCTAVYLVIRVLVASESARHESIMQVLKMIDWNPWSYNKTVLFKVLDYNYIWWYNWDNTQLPLVFAVSAKRCDDLQWLECKYQTLIEGNSHLKVTAICLKETLAHLYDRFLGDESKAILIWKSIIAQRRVLDSDWYETFYRARNRAVAAYGYRLLTNCLRETGNAQSLLVWELEKLCDTEIQSPSCNHVLFDGQPGVYMGIWHRLKGREQEARNYFKPYVLQAVSWRDVESGKLVMHVKRVLGHLFAMIGDDEDAITLLQHVHSPLDLRDGTSATPEERMASPWPLVVQDRVWYCHICLRSWGNFVNCNVCRRCRADICEKCIDSVKLGDPEISYACDASHEWLKIPAPPGVPGTYPLSRGGKPLSIEEYMEAVERDWM